MKTVTDVSNRNLQVAFQIALKVLVADSTIFTFLSPTQGIEPG